MICKTINEVSLKQLSLQLKDGKVLVLPFDTVYGIVADPFNEEAIDKIYKIKGRDFNKPIALIFSSVEMLSRHIEIDEDLRKFIDTKVPGAYTFIFPWSDNEKNKFAKQYHNLEKVGIRIPDYKFILELVEELDQPLAATSANVSEKPNCWSIDEFVNQIEGNEHKPDLIVDAGELDKNPPSEVIDISSLANIETIRNR